MATGDINNFIARLKSTLPPWFGDDETPILDGLLSGYAELGAFLYVLYLYTVLQTRIKTATDDFLDLISIDFFGGGLPRLPNENDAQFRKRIIDNIFRERATRHAIIKVLTDLTGRAPQVFEPTRPADTGGYRVGGAGYSAGGGWGSILIPFQAFITAYRPVGNGIPNIDGYGYGAGGYGVGQIEYINLSYVITQIPDSLIYSSIDQVKAAGVAMWVKILS